MIDIYRIRVRRKIFDDVYVVFDESISQYPKEEVLRSVQFDLDYFDDEVLAAFAVLASEDTATLEEIEVGELVNYLSGKLIPVLDEIRKTGGDRIKDNVLKVLQDDSERFWKNFLIMLADQQLMEIQSMLDVILNKDKKEEDNG